MTTSQATWSAETHQVAGAEMQVLKGGSGDPLVVLHDEMGQPGWLRFHEELAQSYTVYAPSLPGFGVTGRIDWIMNVRDMAGWTQRALEELGLSGANIIGSSLGGWVVAEMAAQCPGNFNKMALVAPAGILPPTGEILDMFLLVSNEFITAGFSDPGNTPEFAELCPEEPTPEQIEAWETAREEACRLSWRPYMYDPGLPPRLALAKGLDALIVWGRQDEVVPASVGEVYVETISGSRIEFIEGCGHRPEVEKTEEFVALIKSYFG